MTDVIQRAFNVGEVSEDYWNRNDLEWFNRSVRLCKNFIPTASGPLVNRQGLKFYSEITFKPKILKVFNENTNIKWYICIGEDLVSYSLYLGEFYCNLSNGNYSPTSTIKYGSGAINPAAAISGGVKDFVSCPLGFGNPFLSGILTFYGNNTSYNGMPPYNISSDGNTFTVSDLKHISYLLAAPSPVTVTIPGAATIPVYYQVSTIDVNGTESLPSTIASGTGDSLSASNQAQISWNEPNYNGFTVTKYYIYRVETKISRFVGDLPATSTGSAKTFIDFKFDRDVNLGPITTTIEYNSGTGNLQFIDCNSVCLHQQRLIGSKSNTYFSSRTGNPQSLYYNNPIQNTDSFVVKVFNSKDLMWVRSVGGSLMFFDPQGIYLATGDQTGTLTPTNSGVTLRWAQTVKDKEPLLFKNNVGFFSNNWDFVALFKNPNGADSFQSKNLSDLCPKFSANEIVYSSGYSSLENELIWITSDNSASSRSCRSITLNEDQGVYSWAQHETDGKILCVNQNIFIVQRVINGVTKYYVEYMEPRQDDRVNGVFLDSYKTYTSPSVNITGLGHLEAKQVYAVVDGLKQGPYTVSGGAITLTSTGTTVHVGLPYESVVTTHDLDLVGNQTLVRQPKTTSAANVYFKNTVNGQVRVNADPWQEIRIRDEGDAYGPIQLQSGLTEDIHMSTSPRREQTISVRQNEPFPMTITAIARSVRT